MAGIGVAPRAEPAPIGGGGLARGQPHHPRMRLTLDGIQRALRAIVSVHGGSCRTRTLRGSARRQSVD
ncbi:hypothetical protein G6F59_018751 [Rhizopus arrhizus]|nr:hypothetical protein G6F24_016882 [Rhizopus arrhizus]KAG1369036.1 hypothetical protein G6F59_018751 [Rhizopus arrhizus]